MRGKLSKAQSTHLEEAHIPTGPPTQLTTITMSNGKLWRPLRFFY